MGVTRTSSDLLYGTIDLLVLKSLSWQAMHGYAISRWLRERSGGTLAIDDAALYKSLHRLEEEGAITSEWGLSDNNRKARYYRLAPPGRKRLKAERAAWQTHTLGVSRILRAAEP